MHLRLSKVRMLFPSIEEQLARGVEPWVGFVYLALSQIVLGAWGSYWHGALGLLMKDEVLGLLIQVEVLGRALLLIKVEFLDHGLLKVGHLGLLRKVEVLCHDLLWKVAPLGRNNGLLMKVQVQVLYLNLLMMKMMLKA